jgi:hypothetical protein
MMPFFETAENTAGHVKGRPCELNHRRLFRHLWLNTRVLLEMIERNTKVPF